MYSIYSYINKRPLSLKAQLSNNTLSMIHNPMYNKRPLGLTALLSNCICYTNDV